MLVDANGHQVHATVTGSGEPTVVFVAALGESGRNWAAVQDALGDDQPQVVYDRAGIGASPPRPDWNTPHPYSAFADELAGVMGALGVDRPAVLVGHSVGSLIVRAFTAHCPERVAGLVHVDGTMLEWMRLPGDRDGDDPRATRVDLNAGETEIRFAPQPSPVPAVVLSRTPGQCWVDSRHLPVNGRWTRCQADFARSLGAVHVVADDAGHRLQEETPGLVAYAVQRVIDAVRTGNWLDITADALHQHGGHLV